MNSDFTKLIRYCIKNEHWSVFEQAYMTLQIETTRGLAAQILRHRSFTFQEFSQRYADSRQLGDVPIPELRRQDNKNRQNSISDLQEEIINNFNKKIKHQFHQNKKLYEEMLEASALVFARHMQQIGTLWSVLRKFCPKTDAQSLTQVAAFSFLS